VPTAATAREPNWSAHGAKIIFRAQTSAAGVGGLVDNLFVANPDGSGVHAVTKGAKAARSPRWNPKARPGGR